MARPDDVISHRWLLVWAALSLKQSWDESGITWRCHLVFEIHETWDDHAMSFLCCVGHVDGSIGVAVRHVDKCGRIPEASPASQLHTANRNKQLSKFDKNSFL